MLECKNCKDQDTFCHDSVVRTRVWCNKNKVSLGMTDEEKVIKIVWVCPRCGAEVGREDND